MNQSLGEILKKTRKEKGYSQQKLASVLKIEKSYISKLENGKNDCSPSRNLIERIALFVEEDRDILARKAGIIEREDWQIYEDLYFRYGEKFLELLRKMKQDEIFAERILKRSQK